MPEEPTFEQHLTELQEARVRRDSGHQHAEYALDSRWRAIAKHEIQRLADSGQTFTAETIRDRIGGPIGSPNAFGALLSHACREGLIEPCGYVQAQRATSNGRVLRMWKGTQR